MILNEADSVLFDMLSDSSSRTFFFFSDLRTNTSRWSKGAVEYFGLESEMLHPALERWTELIYPDDLEGYLTDFQEMAERHGTYHDCEYRIRNVEGEYVWVNCKGVVRYDENDTPTLFAGFVTNMGTRNKFDPVTNLLTEFEFRNDLDTELQRGKTGAAIQINIRHFKRINDLYTYRFGDMVLRAIADQLRQLVNSETRLYRMDGTDYALIIPDATKEQVDALYERITKSFEQLNVEGKEITLQIKSCCVFYPENGKFVDPLKSHLDYGLSRAKLRKSSDLVYFTEDIHQQHLRQEKLQEALRKSVQKDCEGFRMVYQPILKSENCDLEAAEALLRWNNDDFEGIGPMEFVPILEETGLIKEVGKWILTECIRNISKWEKESGKRVKVHVNMSLIQFMDPEIISYVCDELEKYQVSPELLVLELTESCRVEYSEELGKELEQFRRLGIEIALDDFGTGYASLSVLKDIPADIVKLDHTLIRSILNRPKDKSLIEFIIMYCKKVDISVCAEGVENGEILDIVTEAGANLLQGYHFDKPLEVDTFYDKYIK